jgi:hypothetical protein
MTHSLLKALAGRGHEVEVVVREGDAPWSWEGITVTGGSLPRGEWHPIPDADVLVYHTEFYEGSVENWPGKGPRVAICHNARLGVELGLRNCPPTLAVANSEWMVKQLRFPRTAVVHPPVPEVNRVSGDRVTLVNLEETSKVGPFWDIAEAMPDVEFLGVRGGYGKQDVRDFPNVEVIDPVPASEMTEKVWGRTRALLVPSATESWSMVASEAMAHGIPVIGHHSPGNVLPGLQENLAGVGLWADRDQPWQWVDRIRWLWDRWNAYSDAAVARAREQRKRHLFEVESWCEVVEGLCR